MSAVDKSSDHAGQGDGNLKLLQQEDVCKKHCKSLPLHSCDWLHHRLPTPADNVRSVVHERCLAVTSLHLELLKPPTQVPDHKLRPVQMERTNAQ